MPRIRQKRLAKALVLNELSDKPKTSGAVLESVSYPASSATQPGRVIAQKGVQEALREESKTLLEAAQKKGLTPEKIINKINLLLEGNKDKQSIDKGITHALKIGIGGGYAAEKTQSLNFNLNASVKDINKYKEIGDKYEEELKKVYADS